jgi:hypothetical protein
MKTIKTTVIFLSMLLSYMAIAQGERFALFNGENLDGWNKLGDAEWRIRDGVLMADEGSTSYLVTEESYEDFLITLEFWVDDPANSGIFIRCAEPENVNDQTCYEVNIFDQRPDPIYRTGGIVGVAPILAKLDTGGRWNTYEIRVEGDHMEARINGILTADDSDSRLSSGPIALQYGSGIVKFRNVNIKPL